MVAKRRAVFVSAESEIFGSKGFTKITLTYVIVLFTYFVDPQNSLIENQNSEKYFLYFSEIN